MAALAYQHVWVLFSGSTPERRHAMEHGATCCDKIGKSAMAAEMRKELKSD